MLWIKDLFSFGENIMELVRKCIYTDGGNFWYASIFFSLVLERMANQI